MSFAWKDEHMPIFLKAYQKHSCLWDTKSRDYHKYHVRENAYEAILDYLDMPELTVDHIKAKIKTIRTRYCKELTRIKKSEKTAFRSSDIYAPRIFWFREADAFLREVTERKMKDYSPNVWPKGRISEKLARWSNGKSLRFIKSIYKVPILWDGTLNTYADIAVREEARKDAWADIIRKYDISLGEAQKKYRSLRTYFRYEQRKLRSSKEPTESTWFAYNAMALMLKGDETDNTATPGDQASSFTPVAVENISLPQIQPRQPAVRQPVVRQPVVRQPVVRQPPVRQPVVRQFAHRELTPRSPSPQLPPVKKVRSYIKPYPEIHSTPHRNTPPPIQNQSIYQDRDVHICSSCPCIVAQENEYDKIGKAWASELQKMTSDQQIFAKRAIAEIIFEGQLGALHRQSVVINHVGQQMTNESSPSPFVVEKEEPDFDC